MGTPQKHTLLLVDDDENVRDLVAHVLTGGGFAVEAVASAGEALERLRRGRYGVIVSDEDLGGESGSDMLCRASALGLTRDVCVVMYTASTRRVHAPQGTAIVSKLDGTGPLLAALRRAA